MAVTIEAIGKLDGYKEIEDILMEILLTDASENNAREHAARALGKVGDKRALDALIKIAQDKKEDNNVRIGAVDGLGNIQNKWNACVYGPGYRLRPQRDHCVRWQRG